MMFENNPTALITGASSGIGSATARALSRAGYAVVLVARNESRLMAAKKEIEHTGGMADYLVADLGLAQQRLRVSEWVLEKSIDLDVLVNNAGFAWYGFAEKLPWNLACDMLAVNVEAVVHLTTLFLPVMKSNRRGHIINISSIAGSIPSQGIALYSATKSFIDSFTTAVHRELTGSGVNISAVRAGAVATPFFEQAANRSAGRTLPARKLAIQPEVVARRIMGLITRPRRVIYVPRILGLVPFVELTMGWLMDRVGPLLLKRAH
jgi:short-subunit dehydrogenase